MAVTDSRITTQIFERRDFYLQVSLDYADVVAVKEGQTSMVAERVAVVVAVKNWTRGIDAGETRRDYSSKSQILRCLMPGLGY